MIVENGKVVTHYVYGENGLAKGILSLPDVNKNGLFEIILVHGDINQGYGQTTIEIIETTGQNTTFLGRTKAHTDNSGASEKVEKMESTEYKISVQSSTNPVFFRETYQQKGETGKLQLTKKAENFSLETKEPAKFIKIV